MIQARINEMSKFRIYPPKFRIYPPKCRDFGQRRLAALEAAYDKIVAAELERGRIVTSADLFAGDYPCTWNKSRGRRVYSAGCHIFVNGQIGDGVGHSFRVWANTPDPMDGKDDLQLFRSRDTPLKYAAEVLDRLVKMVEDKARELGGAA